MIRLAILGTGGMAQRHAEEFQKIEGVELVACADIHLPVAQKFAKKNNIPQAFSSLEGLLAFAEFDATPKPQNPKNMKYYKMVVILFVLRTT